MIDKTIQKVGLQLKEMIPALNQSIENLRPLVDEYNTSLSQISAQRPKGFFKSNEAAQLKKALKGFQEESPGKKGLLWLWDQQNEIICGFKKIQAMSLKLHKISIGLYGFVDKKVNSSAFFKGAQSSVPLLPEGASFAMPSFETEPEGDMLYEHTSNKRSKGNK